jgi:hypothetical protein
LPDIELKLSEPKMTVTRRHIDLINT